MAIDDKAKSELTALIQDELKRATGELAEKIKAARPARDSIIDVRHVGVPLDVEPTAAQSYDNCCNGCD